MDEKRQKKENSNIKPVVRGQHNFFFFYLVPLINKNCQRLLWKSEMWRIWTKPRRQHIESRKAKIFLRRELNSSHWNLSWPILRDSTSFWQTQTLRQQNECNSSMSSWYVKFWRTTTWRRCGFSLCSLSAAALWMFQDSSFIVFHQGFRFFYLFFNHYWWSALQNSPRLEKVKSLQSHVVKRSKTYWCAAEEWKFCTCV